MQKQKQSTPNRQSENESNQDVFFRAIEAQIRQSAKDIVHSIFEDEVTRLCGNPFTRKKKGQLAYRAGSESVFLPILGRKEQIRKPRVRRSGSEVTLQSYESLRTGADLGETIFKLMVSGLSTRKFSECLQDVSSALGVSKSKISREFIRESRAQFNKLNSRKFPGKKFFSLFVDGVHIADEVLVVILGIDQDGTKHFLSIAQGSSEHTEIVLSALRKLQDRGIEFTDRTLVVSDGAKGIEKALRLYFGDDYDHQRCILHKMRNIAQCLPKKYQEEFKHEFMSIFQLNEYSTAQASLNEMETWLGRLSESARSSLLECKEELFTCHRIGVPVQIRKTFLTTNPIDSAFSNPRYHWNRVKRWKKNRDMVLRWTAALLSAQELKFRRVKCYAVIPEFLEKYLGENFLLEKENRKESVSISA